MQYINILCTCDQHKSKSTADLIYSFTADQEIKVLDYIKMRKDVFFGGSKAKQNQNFSDLFKRSLETKNLAEAINSDTNIYALVRQIPHI